MSIQAFVKGEKLKMVCPRFDATNIRCNVSKERWTGLGTFAPKPEMVKTLCSTDKAYETCERYKLPQKKSFL